MGKFLLIIGAIVAGIAFLYYLFADGTDKSPKGFLGALGSSVGAGAATSAGCFVFIVEAIIALLPIIIIICLFQSC